jgi:hypothetical protein
MDKGLQVKQSAFQEHPKVILLCDETVSSRFKPLQATFNLFDRALGTLPASDETSKPVRTISWATQAATV